MGIFDAIDLAGSGMSAQRLRMDVTSENLANADTTRTASGGAYQRQEVLLAQVPGSDFGSTLAGAMGSTSAAPVSAGDGNATPAIPGGVEVTGIVSDKSPGQLVYNPGSPDANAQGYVTMPNVNTVTEMTDLIDESNSYQSDVTAMNTAKQMFSSMLQVLK
jgi:flagellar basal-body rod protein FlgC